MDFSGIYSFLVIFRVNKFMKLKVFVTVMLVFLVGCSTFPEKLAEREVVAAESQKAAKVNLNRSLDKLTPEVLYLLLTAELAAQRGMYDVALDGYVQAAGKVFDPRIAERATKIALFRKNYREAQKAASLWLERDPENLIARRVGAMLAIKAQNGAALFEHMQFVLDADPAGFEGALFELINTLDSVQEHNNVFAVLERLLRQYPKKGSIYLAQAILSLQQGELKQAKEKVTEALLLQPDWVRAHVVQAQVAVQLGDFQEAEKILQRVIKKRPEMVELKVLLAQTQIKNRNIAAAAKTYQGVLDMQPYDMNSQYALAMIYLQLNKNEQAKSVLLGLVDKPVWSDRCNFHLGRIAAIEGDLERAIGWFDRVLSGDQLFGARINAIELLMDRGFFERSGLRLDKVKALNSSQELRLVLLRSQWWSLQSLYIEAFNLLTQSLEKMPDRKEVLYTRALVAEKLDKLAILESDLLNIIERYPDDANALNALGYTLVDRTERLAEAEVYLTRAIALKGQDAVIIDSYGWLKYRQGLFDQAVSYLQKAYRLEREPEIAGHLVEALWTMGRKQEARGIFEEAVSKYPGDAYLLEISQDKEGLLEGLVKD